MQLANVMLQELINKLSYSEILDRQSFKHQTIQSLEEKNALKDSVRSLEVFIFQLGDFDKAEFGK